MVWPPLGSTWTCTGGWFSAGAGAGCGGVMSWTLTIGRGDAGDLDLVGRGAGRHVDGHRDLRAPDERDKQRALLGRCRHRRGAETGKEKASRRQANEQLALVHAKTRRPKGVRRRDPSMGLSGRASDVFSGLLDGNGERGWPCGLPS